RPKDMHEVEQILRDTYLQPKESRATADDAMQRARASQRQAASNSPGESAVGEWTLSPQPGLTAGAMHADLPARPLRAERAESVVIPDAMPVFDETPLAPRADLTSGIPSDALEDDALGTASGVAEADAAHAAGIDFADDVTQISDRRARVSGRRGARSRREAKVPEYRSTKWEFAELAQSRTRLYRRVWFTLPLALLLIAGCLWWWWFYPPAGWALQPLIWPPGATPAPVIAANDNTPGNDNASANHNVATTNAGNADNTGGPQPPANNTDNLPPANNADTTPTRVQPLSRGFRGGELPTGGVHMLQGGIYDISAEIVVPRNTTLRLDGGTTLRFAQDIGITVYGRLEALANDRCELLPIDPRNGFAGVLVDGKTATLRLNSCDLRNARGREPSPNARRVGGAVYGHQCESVTLRGCTISECRADGVGGAVALDDCVGNIEGCRFERNFAGASGGAISAHDAALSVLSCSFIGNRAESGGGGAIAISGGNLQAREVEFEGNQTGTAGGALLAMRTALDLSGVRFTQNRAEYENGGAIAVNGSKLLLVNALFDSNTASNGGAIALDGPVGEVRLEGVQASHNKAGLNGGFLMASSFDRIMLPACQLHENQAMRGGAIHITGGQLQIDRAGTAVANLADNTARSGGAIHATSSRIQIVAATFTSNHSDESGGAILLSQAPGDLTLIDCRFSSNHAGESGGAVDVSRASLAISGGSTLFEHNYCVKDGGAVRLSSAGPSTARDATFRGNVASSLGLAFELPPEDQSPAEGSPTGGEGGAVAVGYCDAATFSGCTFDGNRAGAGGAVALTSLNNQSTQTFNICNFTGNRALRSGGAVVANGGTVHVVGGTASTNRSATSGGAFHLTRDAELRIRGGMKLSENRAHRHGGAIKVLGARLKLSDNCELSGNQSIRGGAIDIDAGSTECAIASCAFRYNVVTGVPGDRNPGGAIAILDSHVTITGSTFQGNRAVSRLGTAVWIEITSSAGANQRTDGDVVFRQSGNSFSQNFPEGPNPVQSGTR
ncbi:MAG: right-handed parallel beta-helix repeat-containing protein, partial [Planctomycetota bacterium]